MNVGEICNRTVVIAEPETTLLEAARLMRQHRVGDVILIRRTSEGPVPIGIVTDRDLVTELLARDVALELPKLKVSDLFVSEDLLVARETDDPAHLLKEMRARSVRRVPVIDEQGVLQGIVTLDDLLDVLAGMLDDAAALAYHQADRERERGHRDPKGEAPPH